MLTSVYWKCRTCRGKFETDEEADYHIAHPSWFCRILGLRHRVNPEFTVWLVLVLMFLSIVINFFLIDIR